MSNVTSHDIIKNDSVESPTLLPNWLIKMCQPARMLWLGPLLGFILTIPSIFSGFVADDHFFQQNTMGNNVYFQRSNIDYFNFVSSDEEVSTFRERGILGWWTPNEFRIHFFKPLSSLIHAIQFRYFANSPWLMHLSIALLYALLILITALLLKRISTSSIAIGIGIFLFAINDAHAYSSGWISSHNTILTCIFGYLSLLMHDRWCKSHSTFSLAIALITFIFSLGFSEGGLAIFGYLIAYSIFIKNGKIVKKIYSLLPYILIASCYLIYYSAQNYGVTGSDIYINPSANPIFTFFTILNNTAILALSQIISLPPVSMTLSMVNWGGFFAIILLLLIGLFLNKFFKKNKTASFYGLGMILTLIPFSLSGSQERLLLWSGLGAAGLFGEICIHLGDNDNTGKIHRFFFKGVMWINIVISLLLFVPTLFYYFMIENTAKNIEKNISSENTIIINSPMDIFFMYPAAIRGKNREPWPKHLYFLYSGSDTILVERVDEMTLQITSPKGWFATQMERFSRSKNFPFKQGDTVQLDMMKANIITCTDDGRPIVVNFTFTKDINEFVWMKWTKTGLQVCNIPNINQEIKLHASLF